jgi:hypothetical protein
MEPDPMDFEEDTFEELSEDIQEALLASLLVSNLLHRLHLAFIAGQTVVMSNQNGGCYCDALTSSRC